MFSAKKTPSEVLDYTINWTTWLDSDTIATSTWSVATGITKDSDSNTVVRATIWLSGGTLSADYIVTNTVVTAGGRTGQRSILIQVRAK